MSTGLTDSGRVLELVAAELGRSDPQLAALVTSPEGEAVHGPIAASGPRAAAAPADYALAIEAIREGYLLHYGTPRVCTVTDPDLALLAGDFLYALGLERLARLGDTLAVAEFAALISECAVAHGTAGGAGAELEQRWHDAAMHIGGHARR